MRKASTATALRRSEPTRSWAALQRTAVGLGALVLLTAPGPSLAGLGGADQAEAMAIPQVQRFLGQGDFGTRHPQAAPEVDQFGQLVGIWQAEVQLRTQDGTWAEGGSALWVWKYTLDGFAVQDLWLHTKDQLPSYLASLGRPYLLTSLRLFDSRAGHWQIAWAANGAGKTQGMDHGSFVAAQRGKAMVLESESSYGKQRVTFSKITRQSFQWTSEYSQDGKTWNTVMRVLATRQVASGKP